MDTTQVPTAIDLNSPSLGRILYKLALDLAGGPKHAELVDELRQVALIAVWRSSDKFDPTRAAATTWAWRIARNAMLDELRRRLAKCRRHVPLDEQIEAREQHGTEDIDDRHVEELADAIVRNPADFLPPGQARVVAAIIEHGSPARAREALGISVDALGGTLKRARRKIKEIATA